MIVSELKKNMCTGCEYCVNICPVGAIKMEPDEYGYLFPVISDKCINCGRCGKECPNMQKKEFKMPESVYAAARTERDKLIKSSSGGVFAAIAETLLSEGGWVIAGCALNEELSPVQIIVDNKNELEALYGSKYVQATMGNIYNDIMIKLERGYKVLFSGTPCQVDAIKKYTKNHENLYTVEVICHGVANEKMFLSYLEMNDRNSIKSFVFRDKSQGWSFNNKIIYKSGGAKKVNHRLSSYMTYYLNGETYRESCYECKYAGELRGADITIGDFWGIMKQRADLKAKIDVEKGVSCLLINTIKGKSLVERAPIDCHSVSYGDVKEGNEPLNYPSKYSCKRKMILEAWMRNCDWIDVDNYWKENDYRFVYKIWSTVPKSLQHFVRIILGKR